MKFVFNPFTESFDIIGDSAGGAENFSYEEIISTKEVTIPLYQQMAVFSGIIVDGTLNVDGTLVLT